VNEQAKEMGLTIHLSESVKDLLVNKGYDPNLGARPLRRAVQRYIEDPLSEHLLMGTFKSGDHIMADLDNEGNVFFRKNDVAPGEEEQALVNN
jgi:ATP-dependent Clp protease ATP-binding subunit ClpC